MDEHSVRILEFSKIIEELTSLCIGIDGIRNIRKQAFFSNREELEFNLSLAVAMREALESGFHCPWLSFPDIESSLKKLKKHVPALEREEIAEIGIYCLSARNLRNFLKKSSQDENLVFQALSIPETRYIEKKIFRIVDKRGEIREKNIPELKKIISSLRKAQNDAEGLASSYIRNEDYRLFWQSNTPTLRDGRIVLPLKANFKGRIKGVAHEVSSSGSTIFFEPVDLVEKNNRVIEERGRYERELRKILTRLTDELRNEKETLEILREKVGFIDSLMAKARYAIIHRCNRAIFQDGIVELKSARHPLLGERAVPISLEIGTDYRMLIITGPNTGGKTVTLKTVGLLALMNQFGMEIPAEEGSRIGVFDEILSDIGDEQSIEQSLSTFSSHIRNIAGIIEKSTGNSLVLLDELGAGTDPEEGVAIAMALLDYFYEKKCLVIATTHHGILKNYGYSKEGAENASMDFDEETLEPTFHIEIGIPGESHALEIARRNGLPESVIATARKYIDEERSDISTLIKNLSDRQRRLKRKEKEQIEKEKELLEIKRRTDLKNLKLKQEKLILQKEGLRELKNFLHETRREVENEIRKMKEEGITREGMKSVRNILDRISERISREEKLTGKLESELRKSSAEVPTVEIREGNTVFLRNLGRRGKVLRREKNGNWLVETENMKITVREEDLSVLEEKGEMVVDINYMSELGSRKVVMEIDVRGRRLDEAIGIIEKQIDSAILAGISQFSIIHGKGTGALRSGIHQYLKENNAVRSYYYALPEEGGYGKTIVRL